LLGEIPKEIIALIGEDSGDFALGSGVLVEEELGPGPLEDTLL